MSVKHLIFRQSVLDAHGREFEEGSGYVQVADLMHEYPCGCRAYIPSPAQFVVEEFIPGPRCDFMLRYLQQQRRAPFPVKGVRLHFAEQAGVQIDPATNRVMEVKL